MLTNLLAKIREVFAKLRHNNEISDVVGVSVDDDHYDLISKWKQLYSGFCNDIHEITYKTIDGQKKRNMASLKMPKVVSEELSSLIFNEKCQISIGDNDLMENINNVLESNNFNREFQRYLEYGFALGGVVIKPYYDEGIKIAFVSADCFFPMSWDNHGVREALFTSVTIKGDYRYTLLETHTWEDGVYFVRNKLFRADNRNIEDLGKQVSLSILYPNLQEEIFLTALSRPLFAYLRPNIANNFDLETPLGISVYANSIDTLRLLDTVFDSFDREFRLGKKRILVSSNAIRAILDPETGARHRYFDASDETYEAMSFDDDREVIKDITVELRVEEHISAINAFLNILAMQIGFSAGTFTFTAQGLKTATEVVSENSKTYRTKKAHETLVESCIKEMIQSITYLANIYDEFSSPTEYEVAVTFDDSIAHDKVGDANYVINLVNNRLMSRKQGIINVQGVTEKEADKIIKEINKENATMTQGMLDGFGAE